MDPQLKSILTSAGLFAASAVTGWAVKEGYIASADQSTDANYLLGAAGVIAAGLFAWYKAHQVSQTAMIKAVNDADNGVKVVANTAPSPQVSGPIPALTSNPSK